MDGRRVSRGSEDASMTQPAKAQEPSMEEILASIRRIIADEEAKPARPEPPPGRIDTSLGPPETPEAELATRAGDRLETDEGDTSAPDAEESAGRERDFDPPTLADAMEDAADAAFPDTDAHSNDDFEDEPPA